MVEITRIGMDTSKSVFQLHGVDASEQVVLRKKLRRQDLLRFFTKLPPCRVGMEACGGSHYWARELQALGHQVELIPPQYVKPYVPRGKTDAADAEGICEAMSRPKVRQRLVPVKSAENQAALMLAGLRERLVRQRTQLINTIRGYASEFGLVAAKGPAKVTTLLRRIEDDPAVPETARALFAELAVRACPARGAGRGRRRPADGLAPAGRGEPSPGRDPRHRAGRRDLLVLRAPEPQRFRLRPRLRRLDRPHAQEPQHRRQAAARRHHPCRRRGLAQPARGRRHLRDPAGPPRHQPLGPALAARPHRPQAAQTRRRGAGQQDRPHRLEADGLRRALIAPNPPPQPSAPESSAASGQPSRARPPPLRPDLAS